MPFSPELVRIDEVLPDDICGRTDRSDRRQVSLCHPDRQDRILLSEALCAGDLVAIAASDAASGQELGAADRERQQRHPDFIDIVRRILFHEKGDRVAHHDGQRYGPQVERDLLAFAQLPVYAGREAFQQHGDYERQDQQRDHLPADDPERLEERQRGLRADQREDQRR